jgi:hypothetical protein
MTPLERASDPSTPPGELAPLALSRDPAVRERVAENPNTALEVLQRLAVRHAGAVLGNPILDFLGLEDADWLRALPVWARAALLRDPACPLSWLRAALAEGAALEDALAALQNPDCPGEVVRALIGGELAVVEAARLHANNAPVPQDSLEARRSSAALHLERDVELLKDAGAVGLLPAWALEVCARSEDLELALLAARHPLSDAATVEHLAFHGDADVRAAVGARGDLSADLRALLERTSTAVDDADAARLLPHPHGRFLVARSATSPDLLRQVAGDSDWRVRQTSAQNANLEPRELNALALDVDKDVRAAVAANPRTGRSALARLMLDGDADVRAAARKNEHAPRALVNSLQKLELNDPTLSAMALERLAWRDPDLAQLAVAHGNATPALLRALSAHADWRVRQAVARHPHSETNVLEVLAQDGDYDVRAAVALHPRTTARWLEAASRDVHPLVRSAVALAAHSPVALLERLAADTEADVRQAVAVNPRTPLITLETLASDAQEGVRRAVALNPRATAALLERLSGDAERTVREVVADHENALESCALGLFGAAFQWRDLYGRVRAGGDVLERELRFLAGLNDFALTLALEHSRCPENVLRERATADDWQVRLRVARHPNAAPDLLGALALDGDHDVRRAVAANPRSPHGALRALQSDADTEVRLTLAARTDLGPEVIARLSWDEDEGVRAALRARGADADALRERAKREALEPDVLGGLVATGAPWALRVAAANRGASAEVLRALGPYEDWRVRAEVALNARSDHETLEVLVTDHDPDVRRAVALNSATPPPLLERLARDSDQNVVRAALQHSRLEPALVAARRAAVLRRSLSARGLNRVLALAHPDLPRTEFTKRRNLHALAWLERLALATNQAAPRAALEVLSRDANQLVRRVARQRLEAAP